MKRRYVVMIKRHVPLMLGGLALAFGLVVGNALGSLSGDDIEILNDPSPSAPDRIDLGRSFGPALCVSRPGGRRFLEMLPHQWNFGACGGEDAWSRRGPSPLPCEGERMPEQAGMDAADAKDDG